MFASLTLVASILLGCSDGGSSGTKGGGSGTADNSAPAGATASAAPIPPNLLKPLPTSGAVPPIVEPSARWSAIFSFAPRDDDDLEVRKARTLRDRFKSRRPEAREAAEAQLRRVTDAGEFPALIAAFAREPEETRRALLDHFAASGDEGQAALAFAAITAPDARFRHAATERIRRPVCDAVLRVVDSALRETRHETVNAAGALAGNLNILAAIPPMIFGQLADDPVPAGGDLAWIAIGTTKTYVSNVVPITGDNSGAFAPVIDSVFEGVVFRVQDAVAFSYRTDLHQSLVNMTSADFGESTAGLGYDMRAWWQWFNTRYVPFKQRQAEEAARLDESVRQQDAHAGRAVDAPRPPESPRP